MDFTATDTALLVADRNFCSFGQWYNTLIQGFKLKAAAGVLAESDVVEDNSLLAHGTEVGKILGLSKTPDKG